MATATTARKGSRKASSAATPSKASKAQAAPAVEEDQTLAAENAAEQEAREEARKAKLQDLKGRIADNLHDLTTQDADSAIQARLNWVHIGEALIEGRELFIAKDSNNPNDKAFGQWIVDNGFGVLGQRPTRAAAIWLAETFHKNPDLYSLFPTESKDGEPLRRSPRTLKTWVSDRLNEAFQSAYEAGDIPVASEADKDQRADVARDAMPNVYEALDEQLSSAREQEAAANGKLQAAKSAAERAQAFASWQGTKDILEAVELRRKVLDCLTDEERLSAFMAWKPKIAATQFKDRTPEDAAGYLFSLLSKHPEFGEVYAILGEMVAEQQAKVAADEGGVDDSAGAEGDDDDDDGLTVDEGEDDD